ncbi:pentatricopeptide repeat-containing family protein [Salix suchowensis]|nr:pentatricopeptide repeat-containing family protein [Salix suchowensis]
MENLVIIRNFSKTPLTIQSRQESLSEFSQKSIKSSISFAKNPVPKSIDSHLDSLCKNGSLTDAITVLDSVAQQGSKVTPRTYMNLLQSCIDTNSINLGRKIHARISVVQEKSPVIETKLVSMYAKCGYLRDARKVFDEMSERNLFTWSAMIGAVELYYMMMEDNVLPDGFLLPKILQAVGNCGDGKTGELLHSFVVRCGMGSFPRVNNSVLAVYSKCGKLSLARRFFESMDERDIVAWNAMMSGYCFKGEIEEAHRLFDAMCEEGIEPGLVTWNILIAGYNQKGQCDVAMNLMKKMVSFGVRPDVVAWTAMISGFAQNNRNGEALDLYKEMILAGVEPNGVTITSLNMGLEIHSLAIKMGSVNDVLVGNSLIDMYSKCGQLGAAQLVFDLMSEKDLYTWNSMIGGYCQAGYCGKAYVLFTKMQKSQVQPNVVTWNTMISGYIQSGDEDQAMDLFHRMEKEGEIKRDNASWNSLIAGFLQIRKKDEALGIFRQMQSSCISPNPVTILSMLPACASLVALKKVKEIHGFVLRRNLVSVLSISNSLIDTYAKSGEIGYSRAIFDRILSKDFITVNSMITGYVLHGCSDSALGLLDQMRELGLKPNRGTLVNIILAHSLAGMVDEGRKLFSSMTEDFEIIPASEHYAAMVDLYGRSGRLQDAIELIDSMSIKPQSSVWYALLTACRNHGNSAWQSVQGKCYLIWNHGILQTTSQFCIQKPKGQSWIEVNNTVHSFVAGDQSTSYSDLFSWVERVSTEARVHDLHCGCCIEEEEEEKEEIVGIHSEKLALAFAIIRSPSAPQSIRIVKNLRTCADCHRMAKYISAKHGCEIYLSDSNFFHHFKSGSCSCGDYW